ncbi:methyl-accepting chemotaxis protein [Shewanella sp. AC91-MNA-CIBAN-0169]|jgi:methyl-accepting chemotaxis protein|uniref:methyl-accepting chemotaxis protein n=1 Tax=Shewanella TaxID=22 RepID=UPI0033341683
MMRTTKSVKNRVYFGFVLILVMLLLLVALGITKVNYIREDLTEITDIHSVKQRYAINFRGSVHDRAIAIRDVTLAESPSAVTTQKQLIMELRKFYDDSEMKMDLMFSSDINFTSKESELLNNIANIKKSALPLADKIIVLAEQGKVEEAANLVRAQASPLFARWLKAINQFIDYQEKINQSTTISAREVADSFQSTMLVISALAVVISIIIARLIVSSLYRSLGGEPAQAAISVSFIADGDLTKIIETKYKGSLLSSLSSMRDNLDKIVSNIIRAGHDLSNQAITVEDGSIKASGKADAQAQLTQDTLENLRIMKSKLDGIAGIAAQTEENSLLTSNYSQNGIIAVGKSSSEMQRITDTVDSTVVQIRKLESTTKEIGSIVSVISSISEQTNLLALNAAIEAARAGESGRGFAVVADEVRQLARRTQTATEQIEKMISEVQNETQASVAAMETTQPIVESGRRLTEETTVLLKQIEQQASASLSNVREVSLATKGQVTLINQVSDAMSTINNMSSESIQSLKGNLGAAQKLAKIANELNESMKFFTVKND